MTTRAAPTLSGAPSRADAAAPPSSLTQLHALERNAIARSLCEAIRLLESEKFEELTEAHIWEVANYRSIELRDETFFERAFTPSKEAASTLALARSLGREAVLADLHRLQAALGCRCGSSGHSVERSLQPTSVPAGLGEAP